MTSVNSFALFLGAFIVASAQAAIASDSQIVDRLLRNYDAHAPPPTADGKTEVRVNIYLRRMSMEKMNNGQYDVQLTFREQWTDSRLQYRDRGAEAAEHLPPFIVLPTNRSIWRPDTFFQNEISARRHDIDAPNQLIRIHANGEILYSTRLSMVISCPGDFRYFPHDSQQCLLDVASYSYTKVTIDYLWKDLNPVQLKNGLGSSLIDFALNNVSTSYCTSMTNTGEYACLRVELRLERSSSPYFWLFYLPLIVLVITSWLPFLLNPKSTGARLTLSVTCVLLCAAVTMRTSQSFAVPFTPYLKAIDIFALGAGAFTFLALILSAVAASNSSYFEHNYASQRTEGRVDSAESGKPLVINEYSPRGNGGSFSSIVRLVNVAIGCAVLPIAFLIFNIAYWIWIW